MGVDPLSLMLIGTGVSLAATAGSTAMGIAGARADGKAAKNSAAYQAAVAANQASVARMNQRTAERDAGLAMEDASRIGFAGRQQGAQQDTSARQAIGEVISEQGASGLRGASQSGVRRTLRTLAAQDRANLRERADADSAGARSQAISLEQEAVNQENVAKGALDSAKVAQAEGKYASGVANMRAFSTGIAGAGQMASTLITAAGNPYVSAWMSKRGRSAPMTSPMPRSRPFEPLWRP